MNSKPKKKKLTKKTVKKTVKPKYKGVKYIAKKLKYYFKKRYPNYTSALPRARQILDSIISSGGRVGVKAIFELERRKQKNPARKKTLPPVVPIAPELDEGLANPTNYFLLNEYSNYMERGSTEIWYRSTISPLGLMDIQGGETGLGEETYEIYFSDFVNYINSLVRLIEDDEDKDYTQNWQVVCTQPELDEETGRWISTIVSGNLVDNIFIVDELNFGFDNSNPDLLPDETTSSVKQGKSTPQPQKEPTTAKKSETSAIDKEVKLKELENKKFALETDRLKAENEKKELEIREKELKIREEEKDLKKVELGIMTIEQFKSKWS